MSVQKQSILHVKDIVPLQVNKKWIIIGQFLVSKNAKMTLVLQNDGRLCLYSGLDEVYLTETLISPTIHSLYI